MRLINYQTPQGKTAIGLLHEDKVLNAAAAARAEGAPHTPHSVDDLVKHFDEFEVVFKKIDQKLKKGDYAEFLKEIANADILSPILRPASCRDAYAFRQHVATARRNRGVEMIPEFDQFPVFYFTNHNAVVGPGEVRCMKDHFLKLDFELEAAIVVGRRGRNIPAEHADDYIFGYTIMNDLSARTLQMEEMRLNLGPAKGKDFATAIGPAVVTPDELEAFRAETKSGHTGKQYDLPMTARVNGKTVSNGNLSQMDWTFAEILERVSYGVDLHPTEVIGSGTVGTGCFLELNGTAKLENPDHTPQWLENNDAVDLEIKELGLLSNTMIIEREDSLLAKKHEA